MVITYKEPDDMAGARCCARSLGLPWVRPGERCDADLRLVMDHGVLWLHDDRNRSRKPLCVDLQADASASKKQLLGRAVGRRTRTVVDATAGWGEDTRRLCAMGYRVTAIERNALMAELLRNAAARASRVQQRGPEAIIAHDAIDYLTARPNGWECVYLDPMFPPKRRSSALAKRRMRLLRELVGDDPDKEQLFAAAKIAAAKRVVVKRPHRGASAFAEPGEVVGGKLVSYDVYFQA